MAGVQVKFYTDKVMKKLNKSLDENLNEAKDVLVNNIKIETPVRTGTLQNSIEGIVKDKNIIVGTDVDYASFVEFGTRYQLPQYFMTKGYRSSISALKSIFKRKLN